MRTGRMGASVNHPIKKIRMLVLLTDGFGGHGGIALYNRDLLSSLCTFPGTEEIVAIPRLVFVNVLPESFPDKLIYITAGVNNKFKYLTTIFKLFLQDTNFDLIVCSHINLIP